MAEGEPVYLDTRRKGLLAEKIAAAREVLRECNLCPRRCGVNRLSEEVGVCKTGSLARVSSYSPHFGEEAPLVGRGGSGTIFITHCNLMCRFCQNFDISHEGHGWTVTAEQLAGFMLELQTLGCHNINVVTPSHVVPQILAAVDLAAEGGLRLPLVYNSGGYDRVKTLRLLEGVFDIYMPDFKFWDGEAAAVACDAPDYPQVARAAVKEMHRQVGDLQMDAAGIARRGLLVRHLVMPRSMAGTREVMEFIASQVSSQTYVNVMPQYRPCGRAAEVDWMVERITAGEYRDAVDAARKAGIVRLDPPRRVFTLM
jgi:putative pyruvate formate lyase activating enzyme